MYAGTVVKNFAKIMNECRYRRQRFHPGHGAGHWLHGARQLRSGPPNRRIGSDRPLHFLPLTTAWPHDCNRFWHRSSRPTANWSGLKPWIRAFVSTARGMTSACISPARHRRRSRLGPRPELTPLSSRHAFPESKASHGRSIRMCSPDVALIVPGRRSAFWRAPIFAPIPVRDDLCLLLQVVRFPIGAG